MEQPEPEILGTVTSSDGTTIGYRRVGRGPAAVLLHGAMQSSGSFARLAQFLAPDFTVIVPDRRGRGLSGPAGDNYSLERECEDLSALLDHAGAELVFGLSSGAMIAMQTAYSRPGISKLALYEPPLPNPAGGLGRGWRDRYNRELEKGDLGAAMATAIKGTGDRDFFTGLPRFLMVRLMRLGAAADARRTDGGVRIADLIPTARCDFTLPEQVRPIADFAALTPDVLLMGGDRSQAFLTGALDALETTLPHVERVRFSGTGHLAADNGGRPQQVAAALKRFFSATGAVATSP